MAKVILRNVSKSFKKNTIFKNINFEANSGELIAIKGRSGIGKSTLLNIIAGLETLSTGEYILDGIKMDNQSINSLAKIRGEKIGYISQFNPMIPKLTVFENIYVALLLKEINNETYLSRVERIKKLSKLFEIEKLLDKKIESLSGGEIQRVSIIRSLVNEPQLIVADEPTGSLDDETADKIMNYFKMLKSEGLIIILATHSSIIAKQCDVTYQLTSEGLKREEN